MTLRGAAAIIGIGELPTQRTTTGRSMIGLMGDAARIAIHDAHLRPKDIDGLVTEGGSIYPGFASEYLGIRPKFASGSSMMGASGPTGVLLAAMAVQNGLANNVLVVIGTARNPAIPPAADGRPSYRGEFEDPYGMSAGANTGYGMIYKRHMEEYGTTEEQFAKMAVNQRFNTLENENSVFKGQPITHEDVMSSRYVNYPIKLLETVMPCGGAAAVVVTTAERANASLNKPVYILGGGAAADPLTGWHRDKLTESPVARSAPLAFEMSGYTPRDMQFAQFYDCYTILEAMCLEDAGLVPKGEIGNFFDSTDTTYKGEFPINTDGGQLSSGQPGLAGGFRHVVEAARQIMGKAGVRQIEKNDIGLVNG
ncbi:MAG: thiolase family protein [Chloroflexota bacterium]|nr:thiolase family protein [Chloroflexota bacterium]|tara:strand:+ start:2829 stop:3929 length:1101 start_codon:yes stop_codon:yes gene_type:complete